MRLPPLDLALSPHTGYTRTHWEAVAETWLRQGFAHASPSGSLWRIPGRHAWSGPQSDALEGFARGFLLAAGPIASGRGGGFAERFASGLDAGTRRGGDEEWLRGVDCVRPLRGQTQPIVEAANIALALHVTRDQLWATLDESVRARVVDWLEHHARLLAWPNNWVLFTAVIEAFLASVGVDTSAYRSDASVRWVESWHLGGGWYTDGQRRNVDYYNAWVIHPFLWAWYDMVGQRDPDAAWRWRQRLAEFGRTFPHLFGGNGSPVQQGRSLTYRTAALAPLWLGQLTGTSTLAPGAVRRLASGTLKYFVDAGVGADGPPTLGWRGDTYLPLTQSYSGPGSPYFAGMGFLGLALPADHPVWTDGEVEQPSQTDATVPIAGAGWLVHSTADDGIVRLLNHGSDKITEGTPEPDPAYIKFAYSTHTAPGHGAAFDDGTDNEFVFFDAAGDPRRRRRIETHRVFDSYAASRSAYTTGEVTSASIVKGRFEVRCHRVTGTEAAAVREGGHLVADDAEVARGAGGSWAWVRGADGLTSAVIGLHGLGGGTTSSYVDANALGRHAAAPAIGGDGGDVFVALHVLTFTDDPVAALEQWRGTVEATVEGSRVTVRWPDGTTQAINLATVLPRMS